MQFRGKEAKHVNFLGDWIFLNDILLHTSIYEANESHTVFSTLVKIDGQICQLLFTYFKPTQAIAVEGYLIEGDLSSRIHSLTAGMKITVIYKDPTHGDDELYYEEGTLIWDENANFSIEKIAAGYDQYIPFVVDIYGNIHYGPETVVYFDGEQSMLQNPSAK